MKTDTIRRVNLGIIMIAIVHAVMAGASSAQDRNPQRGYQAGNSYAVSEIESINLTNGNLVLHIPLASLPVGRGGSSGYTVALKYDSKLWNSKSERRTDGNPDENGNTSYDRELLYMSDQGGWRLDSGGHTLEVINRLNLENQAQCTYGNGHNYRENGYVFKVQMQLPDGTVKEFRPYGDGLAYGDTYGRGYFSIDPNGVRHMWSHQDYYPNEPAYCSYSTAQITTSGMHYYSNDGSAMRLYIPYGQSVGTGIFSGRWTMYYPDGRVVESRPPDDLTVDQRLTDRNGNKIVWRPGTLNGESGYKIEDDAGRFIFLVGNNKIIQQGTDGELLETTIQWKSYWTHFIYQATDALNAPEIFRNEIEYSGIFVVDKIILPDQVDSLEYQFTYNGSETQPPTGNYTGTGELLSITLPSGAKADYTFSQVGTASEIVAMSPTKKDLTYTSEYDGSTAPVTETWLYNIPLTGSGSVTEPDGTIRQEVSDFTGSFKGYPYVVFNPDGSRIERIWAENYSPRVNGSVSQATNAYVKTEFMSVSDISGNPTLTAIKDYDYDKNGNLRELREYDWVPYASVPRQGGGIYSKPTGLPSSGLVLKRKTINAFYNPTPLATDFSTDSPGHYANPSSPKLKNVLKSTEIQDGNGTPVSRSEFYYDDPDNKGNLIEMRVWDSHKGGTYQPYSDPLTTTNSLSTLSVYDQYGNITLTTDARGIQTQFTYGLLNGITGLYPTLTVAAAGTSVARTAATAYDFYTGLVNGVTDVDNNSSTVTEYDAVGRPTKVRRAAGTPLESWTLTEYHDAYRFVVSRSDLETIGDGKKVAIQHYDQLGRVRLSRALEDPATEDPDEEEDGIKVQTRYKFATGYTYRLTSNPYRATTSSGASGEETMGWTLSTAWAGGRRSEVQTFSGSGLPSAFGGSDSNSTGIVRTDIDANRTLVTDQAEKKRISRTNSLGQLSDVWEVTAQDASAEAVTFGSLLSGYAYKTSYVYDTLNNLTTVSQGGQTRTFAYSSLSRLTSAQNPESGTILYEYDNNSNLVEKTDARGLVTTYTYDAINRVTDRAYTNEPSGSETPDVEYTYGTTAPKVGKLIKVESSVSTTEYTAFDILGRVTASKQTTDGTDYTSGYSYYLSGALLEQTYPSGRVVKNVLDNNGDLSLVQSKKNASSGYWNYASSFKYNATGAVTSVQLGNGRWESTQFNSRLQLTQIALGATAGAMNLLDLDYSYSTTANNGNVLSQTITVPTVGANTGFTAVQTYNYDSLNRLKDAAENITPHGGSQTQSWKQTFLFDRYGNRNFDEANTTFTGFDKLCNSNTELCADLRKMLNPAINTSDNRLSSGQGYSFDSSGNTTRDAGDRKFTYDAENKQVKVESLSPGADTVTGTIGEYWYDGARNRVKKHVPSTGVTTVFVYDAAGKLIAEYSTVVVSTNDAKVSYLTNDHLGSPRLNTDANGAVTARHDYYPFGEEGATAQRTAATGYAGDGVRKQFTGYERDIESSLDFAQARMYNPAHGRFTAVDPLLASGTAANPQTWNRYPYVLGNPLRLVDPTGKSPSTHIDEKGKVVAVIEDGDVGVYQHKNNADGKPPTEYMIKKRQQKSGSTAAGGTKIGQTVIWHEFREHDKAGNPTSKIAPGAQIVRGLDFLPVVNEINDAAKQATLGTIMDLSKNGQPLDIKTNTTLAPHGPNTGGLLAGYFVTARSAGNFLFGMNGANVSTNPYVNDYLSFDALMRVAGEYEQTGKMDATTAGKLRIGAISPTVNVAPFYGESSYSGLYIMAGYDHGKSRR